MNFGPIQVLIFKSDNIEPLRGEVMDHLERQRRRGVIRVISAIYAKKDLQGHLVKMSFSDLSEKEAAGLELVLARMLGLQEGDAFDGESLFDEALESSLGVSSEDLREIINGMEKGTAFGMLMIEHRWATRLRDALRNVGAVPVLQAFVTPEALALVGNELNAMAEAEETIQAAEEAEAIAVLDALETIAVAEQIKHDVAVDVIRTLIAAEIIEEEAAQEALEAVVAAKIIEYAALEEANAVVDAAADIMDEKIDEVNAVLEAGDDLEEEA